MKRLPSIFLVAMAVAFAGCSSMLVREEPHEIRIGDTGVHCPVVPLAEALMKYRGTLVQSVQGEWKDRAFAAECVIKGEQDRFTAIFLAPQMRLATLVITPPHTLSFDRARQIPDAFEPEYAIFDLAVINLSRDALRRALGDSFAVVERGGKRTISADGAVVAVRTVLPDGSIRYENVCLGYSYTLKGGR